MMVIENFDDAHKPARSEMSGRILERGEHYGLDSGAYFCHAARGRDGHHQHDPCGDAA